MAIYGKFVCGLFIISDEKFNRECYEEKFKNWLPPTNEVVSFDAPISSEVLDNYNDGNIFAELPYLPKEFAIPKEVLLATIEKKLMEDPIEEENWETSDAYTLNEDTLKFEKYNVYMDVIALKSKLSRKISNFERDIKMLQDCIEDISSILLSREDTAKFINKISDEKLKPLVAGDAVQTTPGFGTKEMFNPSKCATLGDIIKSKKSTSSDEYCNPEDFINFFRKNYLEI
jgi:hypothetical protein